MIRGLVVLARGLWRRRRASGLAGIVLALGIGLGTAMFSVLDGVVLRGLPFPEGDRFALVSSQGSYDSPMPADDFLQVRERQRAFREVGGFQTLNSVVTRPGSGSKGLTATYVTGNLFSMLGVEPVLGRGFTPGDEDPAAPAVAILGHRLWQQQFGGDPEVLGQSVVLNREPMTVIGVMPPGFAFPIRQDAWAVLRWEGRPWSRIPLFVLGKLPAGTEPAAAAAAFAPLLAQLDAESPLEEPRRAQVRAFTAAVLPASIQQALDVLLAAVLGLLLLACANTAHLRFGDGLGRQGELAVRRALGAGPLRLLGLLFGEAVLLVGASAAAGLGIAWLLIRLASDLLLQGSLLVRQFWIDIRLDLRACAFAIALAGLAVLLGGLLPAIWSLGGDRLRAGDRATPGRREHRLASLLVAGEIALCFALVSGAGLLVKSGGALLSSRPAFRTTHLASVNVATYQSERRSGEAHRAFWRELLPRLEADPAIGAATLAGEVPWRAAGARKAARTDPGDDRAPGDLPQVREIRTLPGFFEMMDLPLLAGRSFRWEEVETAGGERSAFRPAVVSASFARRHLADLPLGRSFDLVPADAEAAPTALTVVGVAADLGVERRDEPGAAEVVYTPFAFGAGGRHQVLVRGRGAAADLESILEREVARIDPLIATLDAATYETDRAEQTWVERRMAQLFTLFATVALVISGIGLYGVVVLSLCRRGRELAIRSALGARPPQLGRLVFADGGRQVIAGLLLGAGLTWGLNRFLAAFLYQVEPWDPLVTAVGLLSLLAVLALAVAGPAAAAARTDPAVALRAE